MPMKKVFLNLPADTVNWDTLKDILRNRKGIAIRVYDNRIKFLQWDMRNGEGVKFEDTSFYYTDLRGDIDAETKTWAAFAARHNHEWTAMKVLLFDTMEEIIQFAKENGYRFFTR